MKIYLAGPISGLSYDEVVNRIQQFKLTLHKYEVLSPMTGKEYLRTEKKFRASGYTNPVSSNHAIVERDRWMVSNCDILFANLVGADEVSIGTVSELAWASLLGKHTVVAMELVNPHQHAFVLEMADIVFDSTEAALEYLVKLAG